MRKLILFIALMLMSISATATDFSTSKTTKLSESTINGVSSTFMATDETPRLSQFEMPVLKSMKLSGTDIPDGIENGQRTGIRKAPLAATVKISGLVDASTIADNSAIELVGNANLFMDANKTFKCITGNYALTLSGGNILTLCNAGGYAIDALSVTISCPLVVQTSYVAVSAKSGITINSSVNATSTNTCIGTVNGTITINADVTATTSSSAAILNRGLENGGDIVIKEILLSTKEPSLLSEVIPADGLMVSPLWDISQQRKVQLYMLPAVQAFVRRPEISIWRERLPPMQMEMTDLVCIQWQEKCLFLPSVFPVQVSVYLPITD